MLPTVGTLPHRARIRGCQTTQPRQAQHFFSRDISSCRLTTKLSCGRPAKRVGRQLQHLVRRTHDSALSNNQWYKKMGKPPPVDHKRSPGPVPARRHWQSNHTCCSDDSANDRCHRRRVFFSDNGEPEDHGIECDEYAANYQQCARKNELNPIHAVSPQRLLRAGHAKYCHDLCA